MSADALEALSGKKEVTLFVTDDGLGGLSVFSELERRLQAASPFDQVRLLYYNAAMRPAIALRPIEEQVTILDSALRSMAKHQPDAILIACGSLSVIYPRTAFAKTSTLPVLNIVDAGVDLLAAALSADPTAMALIFATVVTIRVGAHRRGLTERGIAPERIVMQACPELAFSIQTFGVDSPEVEQILAHCVREAWTEMLRRGLEPPARVYAGLCCSHYGYCLPSWEKALEQAGNGPDRGAVAPEIVCINPNARMGESLFDPFRETRNERCQVDLRVLSKVELSAEIDHIAPILPPRIGEALRTYEHRAHLFADRPPCQAVGDHRNRA